MARRRLTGPNWVGTRLARGGQPDRPEWRCRPPFIAAVADDRLFDQGRISDVAGKLSGGHCPSARPMARDDSFLAFFVLAKG